MSQTEPMDHVEMKAMRATIRDGITEILLGAMLLPFGVLFYFETPFAALSVLLPLVLVPLGRLLKRRFVYPRIGYAKVARRSHALRGVGIAAVAVVVVVLALVSLS